MATSQIQSAPAAVDPIQQQLVEARRNQLLDAATTVFAAKGFHRATIRAIAQQAGVADGTIYTYFANKDALLLGILDRLNETPARADHFAQGATVDLRAFVAGYTRRRLAILFANLPLFQALLPELITNAELRRRYYEETIAATMPVAERYFADCIAAGEMRPLDVKATVRVLAAMAFGLMMLRLLGDDTIDVGDGDDNRFVDVMLTLVLEGIEAEGVGNDRGA